MSEEVKRYEMTEIVRGMESWHELRQQEDGDYVLASDHDRIVSELRAEGRG
jgi:hypothetical protein